MKLYKLFEIIKDQDSYLENNNLDYLDCEECHEKELCIFKEVIFPEAPEHYVNSCKEAFEKIYDDGCSWCAEQTINLSYMLNLSVSQFLSIIKVGEGNGLCLCRAFSDYSTKIPNFFWKTKLMETE